MPFIRKRKPVTEEKPVVTEQDLSIAAWSKSKATKESVGGVYNLDQDVLSLVDVGRFAPSLRRQFQLTKTTALLFRECTLELIATVGSQAKNSDMTIVLDGDKGVGKSSSLLHLALHYKALDWIVLYFPNVARWTSGKYEYESTNDQTYIQPTLAAQILRDMLAFNPASLAAVSSPSKEFANLAAFVAAGAENIKTAQDVLEQVLDHLFTPGLERPNVLVALDQANALYSRTQYSDKESVPLTADRFVIASKFHSILSSSQMENTARVISPDHSQPLIKSQYLSSTASGVPALNHDPLALAVKQYSSLDSASDFGVQLPAAMDPLRGNTFPSIPLGSLKRFVIPLMTQGETRSMLELYKSTKIIPEGFAFVLTRSL
ncbi:37S ribosomal protein S23 mitochondrial [Kappamyces sp. JEL0829]|nr:37S ribosomal protein S23 mitochondrial [Kappamyces sp. JEL0829]